MRVSQRLVLDREKVEAVVENEYVVWGSSNGGRLADVMTKMGFKVVKVTEEEEVSCGRQGGGGDEEAGEGAVGALPAHPGQIREEQEGAAEPVCQVV